MTTEKNLSTCIGEDVEWQWQSQSRNSWSNGFILSVNRANTDITQDPEFIKLGMALKATKISQNVSSHDRFLVEMVRFNAVGTKLKSYIYCVKASTVAQQMEWKLVDDLQ